MDKDQKIAQLEEKIADIEEQLNMAYDALDERLSKLENRDNDITEFGVGATILIGVVQIIISLLK